MPDVKGIHLSRETVRTAMQFFNETLEVRGDNILHKKSGICYNLDKYLTDRGLFSDDYGYEIVERLSKGWEHHTGDLEYPVPDPAEMRCSDTWKGEGLSLRLDLCEYIAEQLRVMLK